MLKCPWVMMRPAIQAGIPVVQVISAIKIHDNVTDGERHFLRGDEVNNQKLDDCCETAATAAAAAA